MLVNIFWSCVQASYVCYYVVNMHIYIFDHVCKLRMFVIMSWICIHIYDHMCKLCMFVIMCARACICLTTWSMVISYYQTFLQQIALRYVGAHFNVNVYAYVLVSVCNYVCRYNQLLSSISPIKKSLWGMCVQSCACLICVGAPFWKCGYLLVECDI